MDLLLLVMAATHLTSQQVRRLLFQTPLLLVEQIVLLLRYQQVPILFVKYNIKMYIEIK